MITNTDNVNSKSYWDNYVDYWEKRLKENSDNNTDKTPDDSQLGEYFDLLRVGSEERFLDYGCGLGRLFSIYKSRTKGNNYVGIDISGETIKRAKMIYQDAEFLEFDGVKIPYNNDDFDKIMCFAVFDCCNQEKTLKEILRVLSPGGLVLISGKNFNYHDDDEMAKIAEKGARKNGHPNFFTDVASMEEQIERSGFCNIVDQYYYQYREDWALEKYSKSKPEVFYQWVLVIEKTRQFDEGSFEFNKFSYDYSLVKQ